MGVCWGDDKEAKKVECMMLRACGRVKQRTMANSWPTILPVRSIAGGKIRAIWKIGVQVFINCGDSHSSLEKKTYQ